VLILDEPTNDLDTDMLAALEDLLDSWAGTLIVVSHDRYFMERVTDQQYAIIDGHLRHLPGGVDEYLRLRRAGAVRPATASAVAAAPTEPTLSGAERRAAQKEVAAIDRRLEKLGTEIAAVDADLAQAHDDYTRLVELQRRRDELTGEVAALEERWLELQEALDG